jgi:hypothetical protein
MLIDKIIDIFTIIMLMSGIAVWIGIILSTVVYFMMEDYDGK